MNCIYEIKWRYDLRSYERKFCNCVEKPEKFRTSTGFETRDLAIPVWRSNQLSYEAADVGSWRWELVLLILIRSNLSPRYGHVILVSGYLILTGVNWQSSWCPHSRHHKPWTGPQGSGKTLCRRRCAVGLLYWYLNLTGACSRLVLTWTDQLRTPLIVLHKNQWEDSLFQGSLELFSPSVKRRALGPRLWCPMSKMSAVNVLECQVEYQSRPQSTSLDWGKDELWWTLTNCLLIGFREEQSKASVISAYMLAREVSKRRKVQIA